MTNVKRVVSVGAHSLDAEIMGGPLFLKYAKLGAKNTCVHVTQGRLEDPNATKEECDAYLEKLFSQNKKAAEKLHADYLWLGYVSKEMPTIEEFTKRMKQYFEDEKVDLVITHWRGSMHPRHINTHDAVTEACKQMRREGKNIKLVYGETFEDLVGFIPQLYFEMEEDEVAQWFSALSEYQVFNGEINDFPYRNYYQTNLSIRQIECGSKKPTVIYMHSSMIENELL